MRNLKKLLALVLAMVMAFSLMLTASAADVKYEDYPDKDSITAEFVESVQVLTGLKVFQGDEKGFRPSDTITRAEAAAIIYRMATGDVDNRQNDLYKDYGTFTDVKSDDWFAGYVGYCQNAGYIKGTSPTTFNPYGKVTGYEALAMILRVVGYGKNNEFTGSQWQVNVASMSRELGVTKNVTSAHMEDTLTMAAPREVVADLIFMTATIVPTVTYTPALAYNDKQAVLGGNYNETLGQKVFGLYYDTEWVNVDRWGRPGYRWFKDGARVGWTVASNGKAYMIKENHPLFGDPNNTASVVATIKAVPDYETLDQVRECDVAHALEEKKTFGASQTFRLYVNGDDNLIRAGIQTVTDDYNIVATDTVTKVGGQGRITEVYFKDGTPWFTDETQDVVMIDTMLAQVTGKADAKLDKNDHVITPAKLDVDIYDGNRKTSENLTAAQIAAGERNTPSSRIISKVNTSKENWDEYEVGDMILIYANTNKQQPVGSINDHVSSGTLNDQEKTAYETNKVVAGTPNYPANTLVAGGDAPGDVSTAKVLGKADVKQGRQTVVYFNAGKHNLESTDYNDQITLYLDRAGSNTNTTYNWYFDKNGYLIGIGDAKAASFGVITAVYAAFGQGESNTDGTCKAVATVRYADGTTGTVEIDRFLMSVDDNADIVDGRYNALATPGVLSNAARNIPTVNQALNTTTAGTNTIDLRPVYDTNTHNPLSATVPSLAFTPNGAAADGWLYMAPAAASNRTAHFRSVTPAGPANGSYDVYGILFDNLFRFTTASDNAVVAVEVAGNGTNANTFNGLHNNLVDATNIGNANENVGMIYKNLGFVTLNAGARNALAGNTGVAAVRIDDQTQIMVRTGTGSNNSNIQTYDGVSNLPGNVILDSGSEVDWADTDGDGRAEFLYVTGSIPGVITYGLFYYNGYTGEQAKWDGTTGTIPGYLNGKAETLTFNNRGMFDAVVDADNSYKGHLFAIQQTNGVVSSVMRGNNGDGRFGQELLNFIWVGVENTTFSGQIQASFAANIMTGVDNAAAPTALAGTAFGLGANNGNPYSVTTEAVYFRDSNVATADGLALGTNEVRYNRVAAGAAGSETIRVTGRGIDQVYWITPTTNIVGDLDWLNTRAGCDVTIVYDNQRTVDGAFAIMDIFVTPDPDATPDDTGDWVRPVLVNVGGGAPVGNYNTAVVHTGSNGARYEFFVETYRMTPGMTSAANALLINRTALWVIPAGGTTGPINIAPAGSYDTGDTLFVRVVDRDGNVLTESLPIVAQ